MHDALRITGHSVYIDGIAAMPLQPDVDIGFVGIPSSHNIEDAAFGGDHGEHAAIGSHQAGQCFAGTVVGKKTDRLQLGHIFKLLLQMPKLQFCFTIFPVFQFLLQTGDLALQRFPL